MLDKKKYLKYLENWDLSEEELEEYLCNLERILRDFVDLSIDGVPVQTILKEKSFENKKGK